MLHVHSNYTFMWGANTHDRIFGAASGRGWKALAITDVNSLSGLHAAMAASSENGARLICGAELDAGGDRGVALVAGREGFGNLCRAVSECRRMEQAGVHGTVAGVIAGGSDGLVFLASNQVTAAALRDAGARVFYELSSPDVRAFDSARRSGIVPVAGGAVTFVDPADREVHLLLRAIRANASLASVRSGRAAVAVAPEGAYLPTVKMLKRRFSEIPEAFGSMMDLLEECAFAYKPPPPDIPSPCTEAEAAVRLRKLAFEGVLKRYGTVGGRVGERMEHELGIISAKGFCGYFLIVKEIVDRFPRTCGRGSGAASLVSYCLGITNVDPIRHNLYFERFLNPGRKDPPDIDVDFAWDERDEVLSWVLAKYGPSRSAMISNHVTFKPRMAIRETAKAYGLSDAEIGKVTKRLPWFFRMGDDEGDPDPDAKGARLIDEIRELPQMAKSSFPEPWPEIISLASRIIGYPRLFSVHCGGVVITTGEITRKVPVEMAPKGVPIVQWEKDGAEDFGLVKFDLLGNRSLAVIRDAIANIRQNGARLKNGARFDEERWDPESDPPTIDLLARGDSMGVFYVESPAMRQLQIKTGKGDFEHLVIHSSIIRPAANTYIREYVRRLRGGAWEPLHPLISDVLSETYGIMCYQEDVSRSAVAMASFSHEEGDRLRKVLSKKDRAKRLPDFKARFLVGARKNGVTEDIAMKVWEMMESFAGYSFCKPHSASYAKVSFQSAYLKAHHPAEFIAAVISNRGGYYTTFAYVSEARRMGLDVLRPDINDSFVTFYGRGKTVRTGLMQIGGLASDAMERIVAGRQKYGPYASLDDFRSRVRLERPEIEALVFAGAFDSLANGLSRPQALWKLTAVDPAGASRGKNMDLFDKLEPKPPAPELPEYTRARILGMELKTLGYLCSAHPLSLYLPRRPGLNCVKGSELGRHVGRTVQTVGWLVTGKIVYSKHGEPMEFISFEDTDAIYETTFFPEAFSKFAYMLDRSRPYLLTGKVGSDFGAVSLTVSHAEFL